MSLEKMDGKFEEMKQGWESWRMKRWEHFRERKGRGKGMETFWKKCRREDKMFCGRKKHLGK